MSILDYPSSSISLAEPAVSARAEFRKRLMVCGSFLLLLWTWIYFWPQTGDGDAICHFLIARDGLWYPTSLMPAWSRPAAMLPIILPAQFGILPARFVSAIVSICLAWQTIRLAEDLKLRNPILAAPLLLMQPFVFALAGDVMTELPMALGLVIAIRLWWKQRWVASALVCSILPACRPEGFFFCAMWGFLFLGTRSIGPLWKRILLSLNLAAGTALWSICCWILCGRPDFLSTTAGWAWPADTLNKYGRGPFMTYVNSWPFYCGPILLVLFLLGLGPIWRKPLIWISFAVLFIAQSEVSERTRENVLPWFMFAVLFAMAWVRRREKFAIAWWSLLLVFTIHTVLWWRGWFASCGLLRIMACGSPVVACVCLSGWNLAADWLKKIGLGTTGRRVIGTIGIAAVILVGLEYYVEETA